METIIKKSGFSKEQIIAWELISDRQSRTDSQTEASIAKALTIWQQLKSLSFYLEPNRNLPVV